ncbi:hypothetical protein JXB12_08115 [candidate division KSB1 bacterium]|nr:hypothetical protein [candidate division KSB1 bacterium]
MKKRGLILKRLACSTVIFTTISFINGCWNRQSHEITAPVVPSYKLMGQVVDMVDLTGVPSCSLSIRPFALLYDDSTYSGYDLVCDSSGAFEVSGVIPGSHHITIYREEFYAANEIIMMPHEDRDIELKIPKILVSKTRYSHGNPKENLNVPQIEGLHWMDRDHAVIVTRSEADKAYLAIGQPGDRFFLIGNPDSVFHNPEFWGVTFLKTFWVAGGELFDYKLFSIDNVSGIISDSIATDYQIMDLFSNGTSLWVTSAIGKVYEYDIDSKVQISVHDLAFEYPGGIAQKGNEICISGFSDYFFYQFDSAMNPTNIYIPYYINEEDEKSRITRVSYLCYDVNGRLWASDGVNLFKF